MSARLPPIARGAALAATATLLLAGCQRPPPGGEGYMPEPGGGYAGSSGQASGSCANLAPPPQQSSLVDPALGGLAGAGMGALMGNLIAGKHHNTGAILGGAALGGLLGGAGGYAYDRSGEERKEAYYRQQQIRCEQMANQREQHEVANQWNAGQPGGVIDTTAMVTQAQRMLVALNYFNGPVDGNLGQQTRQAVMRFQGDHGLAQTGDVTQQTLDRMRAAL